MTRLSGAWRQDVANTHLPAPPADNSRLEYERRQAEDAWRKAEAASSPHEARAWLERAYRFTPSDQNLAFSLATSRMACGDAHAALSLFIALSNRHGDGNYGGREVLTGIAACSLACDMPQAAISALALALCSTAADATMIAVAGMLAQTEAFQGAGWCGVTDAGRVVGGTGASRFLLDGAVVGLDGDGMLPTHWRRARELRVIAADRDLVGSPIDIRSVTRTEGFVTLVEGGISGWAWHPGAPDVDPQLTILRAGRTRTILATDLSIRFRGTSALARPRGFSVQVDTSSLIRVLDRGGKDVLGSPLGGARRVKSMPRRENCSDISVIVPVYGGLLATLACLRAVLGTLAPGDRLIVVNDASPDRELLATLRDMQATGAITLVASCAGEPDRNMGFPAAANAGLVAAGGGDCVLLNSDTVVFPEWLTTLRDAVHSATDIGTATPLSNDATIFSYPDPVNPAPMPDGADGALISAQALQVNAGILVDVPTGHGFCLYIRAECLRATGLLRADLFAQGYGEENDFCERALALGWRHVAVPAVYVGHVGGASFGTARHHLLERNGAILKWLHPGYRARIDAFIDADPLRPARTRLDEARFAARGSVASVLLITHAGHGGTTRVVRERAARVRQAGLRPVILRGHDGFTDIADDVGDTPNLSFHLPEDAEALFRVLSGARPMRAEIHHLQGHGHVLTAILARLAIPFDVWVHDYLCICARLALVTGEARFCGEPPTSTCISCVAIWGDGQEVPLSPPDLRRRSADLLTRATAVITPSTDVTRRIRRHFPEAYVKETAWEDDPPFRAARRPECGAGPLIVAIVGAIGMEKGYDVLLACARDAAARSLTLRFVVAGFTIDDTPLLETGCAFVTGPFKAAAAAVTIASTGAHVAFLPSIWPETWCFALSDMWDAGLDAVVFDIGTPSERVRRTGRGWILPLGLPPSRVNDALLNLQGLASRS